MLKFAANISTMFTEEDFMKRFKKAKDHGFEYVEIQFPYEFDAKELQKAATGLKCTLLNSYVSGDDKFGIAAAPGREVQFLQELHNITPYYNALNPKCIHIMAGLRNNDFEFEDQLHIYRENLRSAICYLENQDLVGVIEPICPSVKEDYFLQSFDIAVDIVKELDSDHLKLLLDIYHLHKITGDVEKYLDIYYPYAGHIQISQEPDRREPFYSGGEIDYAYVFNYLGEKGYSKPIGCEYFPSDPAASSLVWYNSWISRKNGAQVLEEND